MSRVCHITTVHAADDPRILRKECVSLQRAGYEVTLVAPHDDDAVIEQVSIVALRGAVHNRLQRTLQRPRAAYRAALAVDADLYHFHDPDFLPFGALLARSGRRVVYDAHEDVPVQVRNKEWIPAPARRPVSRVVARVEAAAIAQIDAVVAVNQRILDRLRRHQPRGVVVTNYPRLDEIVPAATWGERARAACYVGSITRQRGARELVEAMALVDAELYLAGAFSPPGLLAELERSPGWSRVRYLGRVDREQLRNLLAQARVGVLPLHPIENYADAYPVKLFEYMAAGIPVVATDVPLWREILVSHGCGICVPHGSPAAMAAAMGALLDDDARASAMGRRGRDAALARFSWQTQEDALLGLYDELLR